MEKIVKRLAAALAVLLSLGLVLLCYGAIWAQRDDFTLSIETQLGDAAVLNAVTITGEVANAHTSVPFTSDGASLRQTGFCSRPQEAGFSSSDGVAQREVSDAQSLAYYGLQADSSVMYNGVCWRDQIYCVSGSELWNMTDALTKVRAAYPGEKGIWDFINERGKKRDALLESLLPIEPSAILPRSGLMLGRLHDCLILIGKGENDGTSLWRVDPAAGAVSEPVVLQTPRAIGDYFSIVSSDPETVTLAFHTDAPQGAKPEATGDNAEFELARYRNGVTHLITFDASTGALLDAIEGSAFDFGDRTQIRAAWIGDTLYFLSVFEEAVPIVRGWVKYPTNSCIVRAYQNGACVYQGRLHTGVEEDRETLSLPFSPWGRVDNSANQADARSRVYQQMNLSAK